MKFIFIHSGLFNVRYWALQAEFATENEDNVESCRKFCIFAAVYKVRGLVVRNAMYFLFLFVNDVV
jgi:hypothetical protein